MKHRFSNKEVRALVDYAKSKGFVLERGKKHYKLKLGPHMVVVSVTPSDSRSTLNTRKDLDKILRGMECSTAT